MNPDDQSKLDNSWMIEEYKALRAEILANEDYQKNLLIYGSLVLATAFGFIFRDSALQPHRCILLFLTQILAVGFWHTFERLALSTEEIGTYIDCYLEKYTALNWEIFQRVTKDTSTSNDVTKYPKKSFYRQFINACSQLPFVIFSIVCCVLIVKETYADPTSSVNFSIAAFSVVLLLFMVGAIVYYEYTLKNALKLVVETKNRLEASEHYRSTNNLHTTLLGQRKDADHKARNHHLILQGLLLDLAGLNEWDRGELLGALLALRESQNVPPERRQQWKQRGEALLRLLNL